jgi:hypothetical protein
MSEPVSLYVLTIVKFPIGSSAPDDLEFVRIVGGTISPTCPNVTYCKSPILTVNSQFPALSAPVYILAPLAKIPSLSTNIYIGLPAPLGNEVAG